MRKKLLIVVVMLLAGLFCLGYGAYTAFFQNKGLVETTGVIERINAIDLGYTDDDNHEVYEYEVYVTYSVDGVERTSLSDYYEPSYEEGMQVKVFYDPAQPDVIHGDAKGFGVYMIVFGVVMLAASAFTLVRR